MLKFPEGTHPRCAEAFISAAQGRRFKLVEGDSVSGPIRPPRRSERFPSLSRVEQINGQTAQSKSTESATAGKTATKRVPFDRQEVEYPSERLTLSGGNKIGVQRGTSEAKWMDENLIKKAGKKFTLVQYDSAPLAVEDVLNGRIVAAAMDDAPAMDATKKKPVKIIGGFGMADEQFGYAVRQEDKELLGKINEGLKKLMATPYWGELKKKYLEAK